MTLGEGKDKVYMLLDEHSAGGEIEHDEDIELKMTAFFDTAQKLVSQVKKILRMKTITPEPGRTEYPMSADFRSVYRVNDPFGGKGSEIICRQEYAPRMLL